MGLETIVVDSAALPRDQATGTDSGATSTHVLLNVTLVPESIEGSQSKKKLASESDKKGK